MNVAVRIMAQRHVDRLAHHIRAQRVIDKHDLIDAVELDVEGRRRCQQLNVGRTLAKLWRAGEAATTVNRFLERRACEKGHTFIVVLERRSPPQNTLGAEMPDNGLVDPPAHELAANPVDRGLLLTVAVDVVVIGMVGPVAAVQRLDEPPARRRLLPIVHPLDPLMERGDWCAERNDLQPQPRFTRQFARHRREGSSRRHVFAPRL